MAAFGSGQRWGHSIRKNPVGHTGSMRRTTPAEARLRVGFAACDVGIAFVARSGLPSGAGAACCRRDGRAPGGIRRRDCCRRVLAAGTPPVGRPHRRIAERADMPRSRTHRLMWSPVGSQSYRVCMPAEDRDRSADVALGRLCASRPAERVFGNLLGGGIRHAQCADGLCIELGPLCSRALYSTHRDRTDGLPVVAVKTFTH